MICIGECLKSTANSGHSATSQYLVYNGFIMFHIVDADTTLGGVLAELICEFGHDVFLFSNPVEYLELMKTPEYVSPVAIFSDVNMPRMNGYDFMHQVKQANPQQKVVIITENPGLKHDYKHLACMYLCKPFAPDSLKTMVAVLMRCQYQCWLCHHGFVENEKGK